MIRWTDHVTLYAGLHADRARRRFRALAGGASKPRGNPGASALEAPRPAASDVRV